MSAFASEWSGERLALVFLAPISPSKPSSILYQPFFEFHDSSVKHHIPCMQDKLITSRSLEWVTLWVIESCASTQIKDSVSANLISLRSISILLKTYCFFLSKYITISIQIDDQSCVKKPSSTGNPCLRKVIERKVLWFDATYERAQTCTDGMHSKNVCGGIY